MSSDDEFVVRGVERKPRKLGSVAKKPRLSKAPATTPRPKWQGNRLEGVSKEANASRRGTPVSISRLHTRAVGASKAKAASAQSVKSLPSTPAAMVQCPTPNSEPQAHQDATCPVCNQKLSLIAHSELGQQAHVNACLDSASSSMPSPAEGAAECQVRGAWAVGNVDKGCLPAHGAPHEVQPMHAPAPRTLCNSEPVASDPASFPDHSPYNPEPLPPTSVGGAVGDASPPLELSIW
jgi:hypothetical protein